MTIFLEKRGFYVIEIMVWLYGEEACGSCIFVAMADVHL